MLYSEAAYFDGAHVQHIADYYEVKRLERIRNDARKLIDRRTRNRVDNGFNPGLRLVHG